MASKRKHLIVSRKLAAARIREILELSEVAQTDPTQLPLFKVMFGSLEPVYEEFKVAHLELLALASDDEFDTEDAIRKGVESNYATLVSRFQIAFPSPPPASPNHSFTTIDQNPVRLPKLNLLKFSGELSQWQAFIDVFDNSVHHRTDISDIHKFQYLLSIVSGEPFNLIKSISLSVANYPLAYQTLVSRYSNKRLIALTHWRALKNFPSLTNTDSKKLRVLVDTFSENLSVLRNLGFDVDAWDFPITDMLLDKLDHRTRERFELCSDPSSIPKFQELYDFLNKQCVALEAANSSKGLSSFNEHKNFKSKPKGVMVHTASVSTEADSDSCIICQGNHKIFMCTTFKEKSPNDRFDLIRKSRRCINCFRNGHSANQCPSKLRCKECQKPHHTLLHFPKTDFSKRSPTSGPTTHGIIANEPSTSQDPSHVSSCTSVAQPSSSHTSTTLLATTLVEVKSRCGKNQLLRALIDPGSQASFIVRKCVNRLHLSTSSRNSTVFGLGHVNSSLTSGSAHCEIKPQHSNQAYISVDAIILPKICSQLPNLSLDPSLWKLSSDYPLADPNWHQPGDIDLLLGADIYPLILMPGQLPALNSQPMAFQTIFGWALLGPIQMSTPSCVQVFFASLDYPKDPIIKFWEVEEIPQRATILPDDKKVEEHFLETVVRHPTGRFEVSLPFKIDNPNFQSSWSVAQRRFFSLEKRLQNDEQLRELYHSFMKDYMSSGHMTELTSAPKRSDTYYIPHHPVLKMENGHPKIRVVFDASAKAENKVSLNDTQHVGPKLQMDIVAILLRFRIKAFVFTCDIRQMYRQVLISPSHKKYQLIWWRFSPDEPLRAFQLNTVTYGVSSSPFLAIRTLLHLAEMEKQNFPSACQALQDSLYVDDIISGSDSLDGTLELQRQLIQLLDKGCFELRKWSSNSPDLLESIPLSHRQAQDMAFDNPDNVLKILGLQWRASADSFTFTVNSSDSVCTKRSILSQIARIYDPLGFLCPVSFLAKVLIQQLWIAGSDWDEVAPPEICQKWNRFLRELPELASLKIPRMITLPKQKICQLHAFSDASELGYCAVVYFRLVDHNDNVHVKLVIAKSKVAPVKSLSIPRLELCGAMMLSNLVEFVSTTFQNIVTISSIHAWTDSQVVLSWLRSLPGRFKPFVCNRVAHIQERVPPEHWRYVPTATNPADIASRGCLPKDILQVSSWWAGPPWLSSPHTYWPEDVIVNSQRSAFQCEEKVTTLFAASTTHILSALLSRFSHLRKIQGTLAYCLRYCHNCCVPTEPRSGPLSEEELHDALMRLIKYVQTQSFSDEISLLKKGKRCPKWLARLSPFIDNDGIVRVGGRLEHSSLDYNTKHPMLLPRRSILTDLVIRQVHERSCHPGVNTTMYLVQQNFWILSARQVIRGLLSKCYRCFRTNPRPYQPPMADLPPSRVTSVKPFSCVGVDYGGPFSIIYRRHRGTKSFKVYLCLFVCFATKAIHLEIANDLSTAAFLAALRRFIARRGRCTQIHSDCGTNFVGAARLMNEYLHQAAAGESIQWRFNPPSGAHFGGLHESGIKSAKTHLRRVIGEQLLTYEEFLTLVIQVESLLNSRPLTPVNSDPNDLNVLSPGHFLTLEPLTTFPEPDLSTSKVSLLSRWQLVQSLHQSFWRRWRNEYLHTLYQRGKWTEDGSGKTPAVGSLVLIKNDQCPPLQWPLGRISVLHAGRDGVYRVATLHTPNGPLIRPLVKLCPLPGV